MLSNQSLIHGLLVWFFSPGNPLTDGLSERARESPDLQYGVLYKNMVFCLKLLIKAAETMASISQGITNKNKNYNNIHYLFALLLLMSSSLIIPVGLLSCAFMDE